MKSIAIFLMFSSFLYAKKAKEPIPKLVVSPDSLRKHVEVLVGTPKPRNYLNPKSQKIVTEYIRKHFNSIGLSVVNQEYSIDAQKVQNVIGILNPEKPEIVVVGGHFDVCGNQPGADDNGSGVSGLLELAKMISQCSQHIEDQIQFVAYNTEEPPFFGTEKMGSFIHAKNLFDGKKKVKLMITLEMIGYFSDAPKSQAYPISLLKLFYPSKGNFISVVSNYASGKFRKRIRDAINRYSGIKCRSLSAPSALVGVDFSDHRNYWNFGYKAIMITDTAFYRNPNYHKTTDTIDTLDFNKMSEVVKGIGAYLLTM